jgi:hypothetical protein
VRQVNMTKNYDNDFFTGAKLSMLDILPKGSKFSQLSFVDCIFPGLQKENVNFHRRIPQAYFGQIWTIQYATMGRKWHQNSRSIMFDDYHTHPIRQT